MFLCDFFCQISVDIPTKVDKIHYEKEKCCNIRFIMKRKNVASYVNDLDDKEGLLPYHIIFVISSETRTLHFVL